MHRWGLDDLVPGRPLDGLEVEVCGGGVGRDQRSPHHQVGIDLVLTEHAESDNGGDMDRFATGDERATEEVLGQTGQTVTGLVGVGVGHQDEKTTVV